MPRFCSSAPRKKLPPPTTTATWMPRRMTVAIWRASDCTTSGSTPTAPPPNTSPESLRTTRRGRGDAGAGSSIATACSVTIVMRAAFPSRSAERPYVTGRPGAESRSRPPVPRSCRPLLLADLEPDEPGDLQPGGLGHLLDGLLVVDDRRLLEQHEVL